MDILKSLEEEKAKRLTSQDKAVEGVKQLLESNATEERKILSDIGLDAHLNYVSKQQERTFLSEKYGEKFKEEGSVFHISEIQDLCMKYRLYFKRAKNFKGEVPADLPALLLRFMKKHDITNAYPDNFYILSTPDNFKGYITMEKKALKAMADITRNDDYAKYKASAAAVDPIIFYKLEDGEHFLVLKKWGAEFEITRRITGFFTETNSWLIAFLIAFPILMSIISWTYILLFDQSLKDPKLTAIPDSFIWSHLSIWTQIPIIAGHIIWGVITIFSFIGCYTPLFKDYTESSNREKIYNPARFSTKYNWNLENR